MDPSAGGAERAGRARMQVEAGDDGSAVQWGEFQGTWSRDREDGHVQGQKLLHGWWTDDRWEAFADTDNDDVDSLDSCADGQWWRDDSMLSCTGAAHQSTDTVSLEQIFKNCFPSLTAPVTDDDIKPLGPPEQVAGDLAASPECSRSTSFLQRDLQYKWEGSRLYSSYLSALRIDPNDKIPPQKNKFLATSPALKENQQAHKASKESELKLVKVASVSVHVSGFSPSHHLQSLFQHWTQSQAKPRLKVAYEFKHRLLV